jgi:hypothetical protein
MKFLMMIKHTERAERFQPPQSLNDAMGEFVREGFTKGWLKETAGLQPTSKARRIRSRGGKLTVTDGPFTEAKEIIGGIAIVETATRDEALAIAHRFMELHRIHIPDFECESEVRPYDDGSDAEWCHQGTAIH